jgi:hypothetical protein
MLSGNDVCVVFCGGWGFVCPHLLAKKGGSFWNETRRYLSGENILVSNFSPMSASRRTEQYVSRRVKAAGLAMVKTGFHPVWYKSATSLHVTMLSNKL